ncbi:MAG: asparaginase [Ardenticatenaceae bacterium]|nr:asparaginase [Ardenticatenaceae bacterium]MCB9444085.1 asparaginase [Ardenticatenaceae bacterium]
MTKRVYIANTGGTIGMKKTANGYAPAPGHLAERMAQISTLTSPPMPKYDVHEYDPLLDSANMTPKDWLKIAQDIADRYDDYDGFVVLHGTDTMAYTASALSFMLEGLRKPVILTGSQIPLCEARNDARENLITAMIVAAEYPIPEVCLYFGDKLMRGCRTVKVNANSFDAFDSPNFPPLGKVGINIELNWGAIRPLPSLSTSLTINPLNGSRISAFRLFPGISAEIVRHVLRPPLKGLVLEAYGVGNGPDHDQDFLAALKEATQRGVIIVDCTQCFSGRVDLNDYATGNALAAAGVISGYDLTVEAALAKLFYLFSQDLPSETVKSLMQTDLRGELTRP